MMSSDFYFRDKIPVAVLGVTGKMGQKLVQQLAHHPWFEIAALCDESPSFIGQPYGKVISNHSLPEIIQNMSIRSCEVGFPCSLVFSLLHSPEAYAKEKLWAQAGYFVVSSSPYKVQDNIPLIVAEINGDQLASLHKRASKGGIIAYPNSIASGLSLVLKALMEKFGLDAVLVTLSLGSDQSHERKRKEEIYSHPEVNTEIEQQTFLVLGQLQESSVQKAPFKLSVQGEHSLQSDKEIISVSVKLKKTAEAEELIQAWRCFRSESQRLPLPTAPFHPLYYLSDPMRIPSDKEMAIHIEQLCPSQAFDYTFHLSFSHTMRGTIGPLLLNAELLVAQGYIYW